MNTGFSGGAQGSNHALSVSAKGTSDWKNDIPQQSRKITKASATSGGVPSWSGVGMNRWVLVDQGMKYRRSGAVKVRRSSLYTYLKTTI